MQPATVHAIVVDDNQDVRDSMVMVLELMGCTARALETAEEALVLLTNPESRPSVGVAFIDVSLPGMSGFELATALRASARERRSGPISTLLVAMTGWGTEADRERALDAGFDTHVVKPLDMNALQALLDAARSRPAR
ncbi:MAG: response regulator [Gemmatimonadaceae bacterium]|nr:response regulator [Gemmatimonadaceae bacterium]